MVLQSTSRVVVSDVMGYDSLQQCHPAFKFDTDGKIQHHSTYLVVARHYGQDIETWP